MSQQSPTEGPSNPITVTQTITAEELPTQTPVLRLTQQGTGLDKKVSWNENTVDNEHMNKKKSKCCCLYKKPTEFGESSSESEDECDNCYGHVEMKKKRKAAGALPVDDTDAPADSEIPPDSGKKPDDADPSDSNDPDDNLPNGSSK